MINLYRVSGIKAVIKNSNIISKYLISNGILVSGYVRILRTMPSAALHFEHIDCTFVLLNIKLHKHFNASITTEIKYAYFE